MSEETIADILAEMFDFSDKRIEEGRDHAMTSECVGLIVHQLARRFEAAWKRESAGNSAAMREALVAVKKSIDGMGISSLDCDPTILMAALTQVCARLSARIERALSAPARNCDLYSDAREALKAHEEAFNESNFHHGECRLGCPGCDDGLIDCKILWLFAPAAERKGEGNGK